MDQARQRLIDEQRAHVLMSQVDDWKRAGEIRHFCEAVAAAHAGHDPTVAWLAWARRYADRIDPLRHPPTMPEAPDATADALQELLPPGWSARGPEHADPRMAFR